MKRSLWNLTTGTVLLCALALAPMARAFEGEVDMKFTQTGSDKTNVIQYFVKDKKLRTQMNDPEHNMTVAVLFDMATKTLDTLMDKQKMYMETVVHPENFKGTGDSNFKITETSNTEEILGHTCTEWDYTSSRGNGKIWFAKGMGSWWGTNMAAQSNKLTPEQKAWAATAMKEKLFPMKMESLDDSGNPKFTMVVVKIDEKTLDSDLFEVPSDYKKFDMGNLGAMMGGAGQSGQGGGDALSNVHVPGF